MRIFLTALVLLGIPRLALACPVCFGQNDSPMAKATNMGIFFMLGIVVVMLGAFAFFFVHLSRRARSIARASASPAGYAHSEGTAEC
ncbi:MAG TPA: hypothetical protein VL309_09780 [Vicinamibacterales bacterium]|jgi:hypothetical protein|nr:hypothetical protein [Vicinamibacterales bacterium]